LLLDYGANIHVYDDYALYLSIAFEHMEVIRILSYGADLNCRNGDCMIQAIKKGRYDIIVLLVDYGADIIMGAHANINKLFQKVCTKGFYDIAKFFLDLNVDNNISKNILLSKVAYYGHNNIINLLLKF
jgi:ankyrin repeat protein